MELKVTVKPNGRALTDKQRAWLEVYLECGNASEAARAVGVEKHAAQYGKQMRDRLSEVIQSNLRKMVGRCAPAALETIYKLATTCPDPKVQLAAAQDLLNRAGYKEATKVELTVDKKSDRELDKEIENLLSKGGIIVTDAEVVQ